MTETGIILTIIWGIFFLHCKSIRAIRTSKIMFLMLLCMIIPNLIGAEFLEFFDITINYFDTLIFGFLIVSSLIPWINFDKYISKSNKYVLHCTPSNLHKIKLISIFLILSSLYSIAYLAPFAYIGLTMDSIQVRAMLSEGGSILPANIFTTISIGLSAFNIYCILFFYIAFCFNELKRYRLFLFISSLSNVVSATTFAGRDQFVVVILFFCIFYIALSPFFLKSIQKKVKRVIIIALIAAGSVMSIFTVARFYSKSYTNDTDYLLVGTLGYIAEQPLVFNSYIEKEHTFIGIKKAFPLIDNILELPSKERETKQPFNWQFGTMYASFFTMYGWSSLIIMALVYWSFYTYGIKYLIRQNKFFNVLLFFCVYLYIEITGIFYLKAVGTILINLFYMTLSIAPLFMRNMIDLVKK